jgi:hypothetical protein
MEKRREIINNIVYTWGVWGFGWVSYYLYQVSKWKDFQWSLFFINMVLAFFVWYVIWQFLPNSEYTNWLLAISWFSSYGILQFLEQKWAWLILKNITKWK